MRWLRTVTTIDTRALALFRIALGLTILLDLGIRASSLAAHYGPDGLVPPSMLPQAAGKWSVLLWFDSIAAAQATFAFAAAAAVAMIVGAKTRVATVVLWILLASIQTRNPLVLSGADALTRLLLFWSIFLPTGATASADRQEGAPATVFSAATVALLVQVCSVYLVTMALKTGASWWNGTAVGRVLGDELLVTPIGRILASIDGLPTVLTWATVFWELAGVALILSPWRNNLCRTVAIAGYIAMHLGFGLSLYIGLFPLISMVGWLPFLPGAVFDRIGWKAETGPPAQLPRPASAAVLALLALVTAYNAKTLGMPWNRNITPVVLALCLQQNWNMFAPAPGQHTYWYVFEGTTADGRRVDLLNDPPLADRSLPEAPLAAIPNRRWGKLYKRLRHRGDPRLVQRLGWWLMERHQERTGDSLVSATLLYVKQHQQTGEPHTHVFWTGALDDPPAEPASANPVQRALQQAEAAADDAR